MSLSPGTRLGHYNVSALLGDGGMGQAWHATDTQPNRQVALKILPDAFAEDQDRLAGSAGAASVHRERFAHPGAVIAFRVSNLGGVEVGRGKSPRRSP